MTIQELIAEQETDAIRRLDAAWSKYEDEARAEHAGAFRRSIASALVRLGARLDRGAIERAGLVTRQDLTREHANAG